MHLSIYLWHLSLTLSFSVRVAVAPLSRSRPQTSRWPLAAAMWRGDMPPYNNRETETERDRSGQGHTDTDTDIHTDTDTVRTEGRRIDLTQR
jgi:hypothetical protein